MDRRCTLLAKNLKEQLLVKLRMSACFGIQLDEGVDVSGETQLLVYCRFPDTSTSKMTEHMLFCDSVGVQTTRKIIFTKLKVFFNAETNLCRCYYKWSCCNGLKAQRIKFF